MDTLIAAARAAAASRSGARQRVFDWNKAARLIHEQKPGRAGAGLRGDWEYTGGDIFREGAPVPQQQTYTYLASNHAVPELELDDERVDCWVFQDESPGWDEKTYWPESALAILSGAEP